MKKSIAWILTTIMMLALLTGCGSKSAKSDTEYVKTVSYTHLTLPTTSRV